MIMSLQPLVSTESYLSCRNDVNPRLSFLRGRGRFQVVYCLPSNVSEIENQLIDALIGIQGRGKSASSRQLSEVKQVVEKLEASVGVAEPTTSELIEGRWQLMFTTRPGTASPIQRTFTGVDSFTVFQEVYLQTNDPRVSNIVKFSESIGELKVEAAASSADEKRIIFQFDRAAFNLKFLPFKFPYPVPFRLLGDKAKGWLDTTYLSKTGNIRISRGSKGTTFVLQKKIDHRQTLLSEISTGTRAAEMVEDFIASNRPAEEDELQLSEGEWQVLWNSKTTTESPIDNAANGLTGKQIVAENGQIKFMTDILPGIRVLTPGTYVKTGKRSYELRMDEVAVVMGPFGYPVETGRVITMEILYSDRRIRISRDCNNIVFVHVRTDG